MIRLGQALRSAARPLTLGAVGVSVVLATLLALRHVFGDELADALAKVNGQSDDD